MYIFKNAMRSIVRSKGRNILIGIIVLVIAVSACIGLSIRQAANSVREQTLDSMTVTAQISFDRSSIMKEMQENAGEGGQREFNKSDFSKMMGNQDSLTLEEMETYAKAQSVQSFYYTMTATVNGAAGFEAVSESSGSDSGNSENSSSTSSTSENKNNASSQQENTGAPSIPGGENGGMPGGKDGVGRWGAQGDFTVVGYSSDQAMTDFLNGTCSVADGAMFEEGTGSLDCIISDELATYNDLSVGDTVKISNPNDEDETYSLTITGIYNNSQSTVTTGGFMGGFSAGSDPANQIYMSYTALKEIIDASEKDATTTTDEDTGIESSTALRQQLAGTYTFASVEDYEQFDAQARELGLSDDYTVTSSDIENFERSLVPLDNLSQMALTFLFVVLGIGAVILIVLNIFSIRDRKYEIGVLTAIGMKKRKVALQFITEVFTVTLVAIILGFAVGAATSVPVTNALLASQATSQSQTAQKQQAMGRPGQDMQQSGEGGQLTPQDMQGGFGAQAANYITQVSSATDFTVLLQLLGIGILLTLLASVASVLFIMRYEPLKILSNRD